MGTKLYVGNLSFRTTETQLRELFEQAGEVSEVAVIIDRETGRSKGFGFVTMADEDGAQEAIRRFNNQQFDSRALTVNEARPREDRPSSGGGRGGYDGRDRRGSGGMGGGNRRY